MTWRRQKAKTPKSDACFSISKHDHKESANDTMRVSLTNPHSDRLQKYQRHHIMSPSSRTLNLSNKMLNSTLATDDFSPDIRVPRSLMSCAIRLALLALALLLLPILRAIMLIASLTMNIAFEDVSSSMLRVLVPLAAAIIAMKSKRIKREIPFISTIAPSLLVLALLPVALNKLEPNYE